MTKQHSKKDSFNKVLEKYKNQLDEHYNTHDGILHFGKYKNQKIEDIYERDPHYLKWLTITANKTSFVMKADSDFTKYFLKKECEKIHGNTLKTESVDDMILILIPDKATCDEIFDFGKHKGKTVEYVYQTDPQYIAWLLTKKDNKDLINKILDEPEKYKNLTLAKIIKYVEEVEESK